MKTNNAATLLNILTALTTIVPTVPADKMTTDDVLDAIDGWDFYFTSVVTRTWLQEDRGIDQSGRKLYVADGREIRVW
jgi:hypothetical protein